MGCGESKNVIMGMVALAYDPSTWRLKQENENIQASLGFIVKASLDNITRAKTKMQQCRKAIKQLGM